MKKLTEEEFQALAAKFPASDVERVDEDSLDMHLVVRGPGRLEWKNYRADLAKSEDTYDPQWRFAAAMLLHPSPAEFEQLLDRKPAALYIIIKVLNDLAGTRETVERKKASRA